LKALSSKYQMRVLAAAGVTVWRGRIKDWLTCVIPDVLNDKTKFFSTESKVRDHTCHGSV
jgi:hypothetical protein